MLYVFADSTKGWTINGAALKDSFFAPGYEKLRPPRQTGYSKSPCFALYSRGKISGGFFYDHAARNCEGCGYCGGCCTRMEARHGSRQRISAIDSREF